MAYGAAFLVIRLSRISSNSTRNALGRRCEGPKAWEQAESTRRERSQQACHCPDGQLEQINRCAANNGPREDCGEVLYPTCVHRGFQPEVQAEDDRSRRTYDAQLQH